MRRGVVLLALVLVIAACGDDDAAPPSTAAPSSTEAATTQPTTTTQATTTTTQPTTTTTQPTTTTTQPTTTTVADAHPVTGAGWGDVWPQDGATATFRVVAFDGSESEMPAVIEYGVEFLGETLDRITIGVPGGGSDASEIYFHRRDPWVFSFVGVVNYNEFFDGPAITERFDDPLAFDLATPLGEQAVADGDVILAFGDGGEERIPGTYSYTIATFDETLEVPFGTLENVTRIDAVVSGDILGSMEFPVQLWLHPDQALVKWIGATAFDSLELVEGWD